MRFSIALLSVMIANTFAFAQIKIEGPKEATVGYRVKAKLTLDVTDPQVKCFPANDDWYAVQDLSGQKYIDFVPGKKSVPSGQKSQLYTFVVAGNKGNKTFLETYEVTVLPDGEVAPPPTPKPEPEKTALYKDFLAAYKVSPNADSLKLHIKLYEEFLNDVKSDKFSSAKAAGDSLKTKFAAINDLQSVQDVATDYLIKNVGSAWNKSKLVDAMSVIVATLKTLPP